MIKAQTKLWMNEASSCESGWWRKKLSIRVCLRIRGDACPSSIIQQHRSHYPVGRGASRFPALPKKLPGNPVDLINLHFPPAGACHVPISLQHHLSPSLKWNLMWKKNLLLSEVDTACVFVSKRPSLRACMSKLVDSHRWRHEHEPWAWRSHFNPLLGQSYNPGSGSRTRGLCVPRTGAKLNLGGSY